MSDRRRRRRADRGDRRRDLGLLVGPRGATLQAIEELVRTVVQRQTEGHGARIHVDVGGYRAKRREALAQFTRELAEKVHGDGQGAGARADAAADRKVVHDAIAEIDGVTTASEGEEPRRRVVIRPADLTVVGRRRSTCAPSSSRRPGRAASSGPARSTRTSTTPRRSPRLLGAAGRPVPRPRHRRRPPRPVLAARLARGAGRRSSTPAAPVGDFLREAVETLGLADRVDVRRAPGPRTPPGTRSCREPFDLVVARGFGPPAVTAECAVGFLRPAAGSS